MLGLAAKLDQVPEHGRLASYRAAKRFANHSRRAE